MIVWGPVEPWQYRIVCECGFSALFTQWNGAMHFYGGHLAVGHRPKWRALFGFN